MREALKNAVQSAILFECQLPHQESGLGKSCLSSQNDICFNNTDPQEIAKVIYNGIVEFALNEYEINYDDLEREQRRAILSRIRYNPTADNSAKLKYGFYGEVLLDLILRVFLQTSVVAARGYFYSPIENSEAKGFDAYHQSIKKCIDHIAAEYARIGISIPATFDYRLFFIFLPLSEVKQIKESVIQWIDSQEPLI